MRSTSVNYTLAGYGPHNLVVGTLAELGPIGLLLLAAFVGPFMLRRGWGSEAAVIQASLISLLSLALFLDIFANRKQVWLVIGIAAGLAYLARRAEREPGSAAGRPSASGLERDQPEGGRPSG